MIGRERQPLIPWRNQSPIYSYYAFKFLLYNFKLVWAGENKDIIIA